MSRSVSARPTIGLVTANIHLGVGATLWSGVLAAVERHDVNLICFPGGEVRATDRAPNAVYDLVAPDLLDGLICWASTLGLPVAHERATRLARRFGRLPMVSLNGALGEDHPLTLDGYAGMVTAIGHLLDVHKRHKLAFIRGPVANPVSTRRYRAYVDTLARHRIPLNSTLVSSPVDFLRDAGAAAMRVLLDARGLCPGRDFDAVVACSDFLAADALRELSKRDIRVPEDVAVVGINDSPEARLADPPLTSVSMPFEELGELAVETLLGRLGGRPPRSRPTPPALMIRRSCGCRGDSPRAGWDRLPESARAELHAAIQSCRDDNGFLDALDRMVSRWATRSDQTDAWDAALIALRQTAPPDAALMLAQARLVVAEAGRRLLEYERYRADQTARQLRELGNALSSGVDMAALTGVLDRRLPGLGIPRWHLALNHPATLEDVLPRERRYSMVAEPLYAGDETFGFALFEVGPPDGGVYRALADQIGAALKEIALFGAVRAARDAAEQANRVKTTLLSSVSDELRSPVEGILRHLGQALAAVESLPDAPAGLVDSLKEINVSAEHQLGVICDLLDLSRAELETLELSASLIDPGALIEDVFRTRVAVALPLIKADRRRLRQGLVSLRGYVERLATGPTWVEVEVLPRNLRIRVGGAGDPDGGGLELPITRRLIALHNGSMRFDGGIVQVELPLPTPGGQPASDGTADVVLVVGGAQAERLGSRHGLPVRRLRSGVDIAAVLDDDRPAAVVWDLGSAGSEDWLVIRQLHEHRRLARTPFLVYGASSAGDLAELVASARPAAASGPILIVDPDPEVQQGNRRLASQARPGQPVLVAEDGTTALALLGAEVPSLVVVAMRLPDMDGFDVLDRLHGDARVRDLPALVLSSGRITAEEVRRAEPHGRVILLGKGILAEAETVDLIDRLLTPGQPLSPRSGLLVKHALSYLHQHFQHQITRRQVARAAGMSEDYLSRLFHRELGISPWDYLTRMRIQAAKARLRDTDDSIQAVARWAGFHDRAYFSRTFRKLTGVPPQAFREATGSKGS